MAKKQTQQEKSLTDFSWDNEKDSFFGTESIAASGEEELEEDVDVDTEEEDDDFPASTDEPDTDLDSNEEEDDSDLDEEADKKAAKEKAKKKKSEKFDFENGEGKESDNDSEKGEMTPEQFNSIAKYQIERFQHVQVGDDEEITPERLDELWQEEKDAYAKEALSDVASTGGDLFKRQIEFMKNGGSAEEFISQYKQTSAVPDFDVEDEDNRIAAIKYYKANFEESDEQEINDFLQFIDDSGKTEAYAKKYIKKIKEYKAEQDATIEKSQREALEAQKKTKELFVEDLKTVLNSDDVEIKIPKEVKDSMADYFSEPNVKLTNGKKVTKFQQQLSEVFADKRKLAILGTLMMKDFDLSVFEKQAASKATRKIKTNLKTTKGTMTSIGGARKRSLSDFFSND